MACVSFIQPFFFPTFYQRWPQNVFTLTSYRRKKSRYGSLDEKSVNVFIDWYFVIMILVCCCVVERVLISYFFFILSLIVLFLLTVGVLLSVKPLTCIYYGRKEKKSVERKHAFALCLCRKKSCMLKILPSCGETYKLNR